MTEIAIIGPGAIGGTLAAHLETRRPGSVLLCARTPFSTLDVTSPSGSLQATPQLETSPESLAPHPWIFLATKAQDTVAARPWLDTLSSPDSTIAILQNGVEHLERVSPLVNSSRLIPVVIDCPATRRAPGQIAQASPAKLTIPEGPQAGSFAELFHHTDVDVRISSDFRTTAWKKLCLNVAGGAITALTRRPHEVLHHPDLTALARNLIEECALVARAEGADLPWDFPKQVLDTLLSAPRDSGTSMLADRLAGRPLEVDARNGAVVRIAQRHDISTPWNRALTALLTASEA